MRKTFHFEFTDDDVYWFTLSAPQERFETFNSESDEYLNFVGNMEAHGVHDFVTTGDEQFIGYHSYEIPPESYDAVMRQWHAYMVGQGFKVGEVRKMTPEERTKWARGDSLLSGE